MISKEESDRLFGREPEQPKKLPPNPSTKNTKTNVQWKASLNKRQFEKFTDFLAWLKKDNEE